MNAPDDTAVPEAELERLGIGLDQVRGVMCMTEGDGLARGYSSLAFSNLFADRLGWERETVADRIPLIMIGGCSGLVSPYAAMFVETPEVDSGDGEGLAIGITTTPTVDIEEFGRKEMVASVARAVRSAMEEAGIAAPEDVHCVQIKAPWPTTPALAAAAQSGKSVATLNGDHAGSLARAAGALGVAVALGEVEESDVGDEMIGAELGIYSKVASASAGTERHDVAVIVMGNVKGTANPYRIGHGVLSDGLDVGAVREALDSVGVDRRLPLAEADRDAVDHVFVKSAVDLSGECRGRRHVMQTDYLAPYSWLIAKSVIHATVAGQLGDPMMQVSGGGEHQGPPGGGLVSVVVNT
jgi:cyanuric acid amidohydrolase